MTAENVIEANGIHKVFGRVPALNGVDLQVPAGSVLALLGQNGAGKTTLVNILATLLLPSSGTARVAGFDVVRQASEVRRRIALTGQFASVDDQITGKDNLVLVARLLGAGRRAAHHQAETLLESLDLTSAGRRPVRTYSGGMRRRLDLAAGLVGHPELLFLDEPTAGLDPVARRRLWDIILDRVGQGATVLLTTQDLDEADRLADTVVVLAGGRQVAGGPPNRLKARLGESAVTVRLAGDDDHAAAISAVRATGLTAIGDEPGRSIAVTLPVTRDVAKVVRALDLAAVQIEELTVTEPRLEEVFTSFVAAHEVTP